MFSIYTTYNIECLNTYLGQVCVCEVRNKRATVTVFQCKNRQLKK